MTHLLSDFLRKFFTFEESGRMELFRAPFPWIPVVGLHEQDGGKKISAFISEDEQ